MDIAEAAETLAVHLHRTRLEGNPFPTNMPAYIIARLKCSRVTANAVKTALVESGRLEVNPFQKVYRIDGHDFLQKIAGRDPLDALKDKLRARYHPVFDPRTRADEEGTPSADGKPTDLIVGTQLLTLDQALAVARSLESRNL